MVDLTRPREEDRNLFGGEFTPFRDVWQVLASDLGITTSRMRRNAADIAAADARLTGELDAGIGESLNAAMAFAGGDQLAMARVAELDSRRERLADIARGAPNRDMRERAMLELATMSTDPILQGISEVRSQLGEQAWTRFNEVRDDLVRESQGFQIQREAFQAIQASLESPSAVGDITLITAFMRMQDPKSVVREGEYALASEVGGVNEKLLGLYNSLVAGTGSLTDEQRREFGMQATNLYRMARSDQLERNANARATARLGGVDEQYLGVLGIPVDPAEVELLRPPPRDAAPSALEGGEVVPPSMPARALGAIVRGASDMAQDARRMATGAELRRRDDGTLLEVYPDGTSRTIGRETQFRTEGGDRVELVPRGEGRAEWRRLTEGRSEPNANTEAFLWWWRNYGSPVWIPPQERAKNR